MCFSTVLQAQSSGKKGLVQGIVLDSNTEEPLSYATVTLYNATDSTLADGAVTDDAGIFKIEASIGEYYAEIGFIGFQTQFIPDINITKSKLNYDLGTLGLSSDAATLDEIEVRAERSTMQMSLDKRVFNVGKDLANIGGNATQVLDNVPSVTVDVEGNVSLRGSGGVRILVNGRPSSLIGNGDTNGLRNIPANLIESIEVITNPSARYEAEGMAGIINIILKKDARIGINGSFDLNVGYPDNYGISANMNYRKNKLNFFANYGLNYRQSPGNGANFQEFQRDDTLFISDQERIRERSGWNNSIRTGADYYFNEKSVLTTAFTYRIGKDDNFSEIEYRDYISSRDPENLMGITTRRDDELEDETNLEYSLTYRKEFDRKGQEFTADIRFQDNIEEESSSIREQFFTPEFTPTNEADLRQRSNNAEGEQELIIQLDYVHPISEEGKMEFGYRTSIRNIDNDFSVEEIENGEWTTLPNFSNEFAYDERVYAAYAIIGEKWGDFSAQGGLRAEYSDIITELVTTKERNARDYFNLFPSVFLGYDLPNDNAVQVSYSRRINRPRFWYLNPFFSFSDARNFRGGNPNLDPEFTDSYEITHIKYWDKATLTSSFYYRQTDGVIDRIRRVNDDGTTISRPENLLTENSFGADLTFNISPYKWWDLNGNANFFRSITDGGNLGPDFQADTYTWFGRLTSKMRLFEDFDTQLRVNYRAPRRTTQGSTKSYTFVDLAISKDVLQDKGTLTLSVQDLFNSRLYRYTTEAPGFFAESEWRWRARQVILSFNYRLNQKKQRGRGGRGGGDYGGGGDF